MKEKHEEYFANKSNGEFCIVFYFQRKQKNAPSIYPALKAPSVIRDDSLTSEKSKAKKALCEYLLCRTSYEYLK